MGYRRSRDDTDRLGRWRDWVGRHGGELRSIGVPPGALATEAHWEDVLVHGHVEPLREPPQPEWSFRELTVDQATRLLALLEANSGEFVPQDSGLVSFLRHRLGGPDQSSSRAGANR